MYCPNCGRQSAEGMRFCEYCGTPLQMSAQPSAPARRMENTIPLSRISQALRQLARSPLYLTGAIAYTCMILFSLVASVSGGTSDMLSSYLSMMGSMSSYEVYRALNQVLRFLPFLRGASLGATLVTNLPAILVCIGIWLTFAAALNRSSAPIKTTGLTMIRVIEIIVLVLQCLLFALIEIVMLFVMMTVNRYDDSIMPFFIVMMLLIAVVMGLSILYYVKLAGTLSTIRTTIWRDEASDRVSAYVAVLTIIGGVGSILSMLQFGSLFSTLSSLANAVASISYGLFLFQYRDQMRALIDGTTQEERSGASSHNPDVRPGPAPIQRSIPQPVPDYERTRPVQMGETQMLRAQQETAVLNQRPMPTVRLIRVRNNNVIMIDRPQFRIGRDPGVADYIVLDNTAVGRQHADIVQHDGACFVVDLKSTNHTYVNGQQVQPGIEFPLHDGDQLMLGDECFQVSIT